MKNLLLLLLVFSGYAFGLSLTGCSQDKASSSIAETSNPSPSDNKTQEARGVKQTPLQTGPSFKDKL